MVCTNITQQLAQVEDRCAGLELLERCLADNSSSGRLFLVVLDRSYLGPVWGFSWPNKRSFGCKKKRKFRLVRIVVSKEILRWGLL